MKLESPTISVGKSQEDAFNFLSDIKNFETIMPESIEKFEVLDNDKFLFQLKGMPEIVLKKKEAVAPNKIVFVAGGGKIDFSLIALIFQKEVTLSEVQLVFEGDFNPMMAMMIKKPISNFISTLTENMGVKLV